MEAALPSVVGGLTGVPLVAVPTSVGYGAVFQGVAALLGMLNPCAPVSLWSTSTTATALGLREHRVVKHELDRDVVAVHVEGHRLEVKRGWLDGKGVNLQPEHDDVARVACLLRASGSGGASRSDHPGRGERTRRVRARWSAAEPSYC